MREEGKDSTKNKC